MAKAVDSVEHHGVVIPIKLDTETGKFIAQVGGTRVDGTNLLDVRAQVCAAIDDQPKPPTQWFDIMSVSSVQGRLSVRRYHAAKYGAKVVRSPWDGAPELRGAGSSGYTGDLPLTGPVELSETVTLLPYDEAQYHRLLRMTAITAGLREHWHQIALAETTATEDQLDVLLGLVKPYLTEDEVERIEHPDGQGF